MFAWLKTPISPPIPNMVVCWNRVTGFRFEARALEVSDLLIWGLIAVMAAVVL